MFFMVPYRSLLQRIDLTELDSHRQFLRPNVV